MRGILISEQSQVMAARLEAGHLAREIGFSDEEAGRLAIIVTELGTNLIKHAGGGELLVGSSPNSQSPCVEVLAVDRGPGMDLAVCLADGFSTAGTQGTGLGAARRQATTFDAWTAPGHGAVIHARVVAGKNGYKPRHATPWNAIARIMPGEDVCGDALAVRETSAHFVVLVADGLGHGTFAAQAANAAVSIFETAKSDDADTLVESLHNALRSTRGAAIAVTSMDINRQIATYCGIGNIAGALQTAGAVKKMTTLNGTAGVVARKVQGFQYPFGNETILVMHSDGISGSWTFDKYPGLAQRDPMLIAAVLYRDFGKSRDDATVFVARMAA